MALIKCIECGKMISEYAAACPNCGCPMNIILEKSKTSSLKNEEQKKKSTVVATSPGDMAVDVNKLVNYRSLCKFPDEISRAGESNSSVKKSLNVSGSNPKVSIGKQEPVSNKYATATVGDYIKFGRYKQDGTTLQDIEWRVLAKEGNRILVISRYGLDRQCFHNTRENVTWENCNLRNWLNTDFIKSAFDLSEYGMIERSHIKAAGNPKYKTKVGSDTWDKVFLLSIEEVEKYFHSKEDMRCQPTEYAKRQGARSSLGNCWWWLRSSGDTQYCAAFVHANVLIGVDFSGCYVTDYITAVRPALWINLESCC